MINPNLRELLLQSLTHEKGGVLVYQTALECVRNSDLRKEWTKYLAQTERHVTVLTEVCEALGLVGTPEYCAQRIVEMTRLGVRNIYLMPFETFSLPEPEIRAFRDVVFPHLRTAGLR